MSNRNEPDDCRGGRFTWSPLSPDYDDSKERALEAYLDDVDNVARLIGEHAERLAVRFVCGQSVASEIVEIAQEMQTPHSPRESWR